MTAICGRVEWQRPDSARRDCGDLLSRLNKFGGAISRIAVQPGAAFGASLKVFLPEDDFDRQPLARDERWLFVADVRLDNRDQLERQLHLPSRQLADSALLFEALLSWGEAALDKVVGDFAFALFDSQSRALLLGRDPTGQRPLFYSIGKTFVAFASMPSTLAGRAETSGELDLEALARALSDMPAPLGRSYFAAIQKVPAGHVVRIDQHGERLRDYWNPRIGPSDGVCAEYEDAYRSVLDEVVAARLRRRTGTLAAQLSSGLDSSAVCASAAALAGSTNVIALTSAPAGVVDTASPAGRFPDESALAADIASFLDIRHIVVRDRGSAIAHLRAHAGFYQEPYRNNINAGWLTSLGNAAHAGGCEVMLTGDGGNLTLNGGSIAVLGELARRGDWTAWIREARLAIRHGGVRWTGVLMYSFGHHLPQWVIDQLHRQFLAVIPRASASFVRREFADKFVTSALPIRHERRTGDIHADQLAVLRSYDFGNYNKGLLAECGVDSRHPLLDRRAIEFSLVTPPLELFRDGRSRSLARRALAGRLPPKILTMNDRGYQAAEWQKRVGAGELMAMVEEIETSHAAVQLLDTARLRRTAEQWDTIDFNDPAQDLAITTYLSLALAGGLFMVEAERGFPSLDQTRAARVAAT